MFSSILKGDFTFSEDCWKDISNAGKEFILALLQRKAADRLTATQALGHPWLQTEATTDILAAVKKYSDSRKKFKKAVDLVIGVNRMKLLSEQSMGDSLTSDLVDINLGYSIT
jgi:serine/threonine protein kinase